MRFFVQMILYEVSANQIVMENPWHLQRTTAGTNEDMPVGP